MKSLVHSKQFWSALSCIVLLICFSLLQLAAPIHLDVFFQRAVLSVAKAPYTAYVIPGILALAFFLFAALAPLFSERYQSRTWRILFLVLICLTILAIRWPFLCLGELNVDESQDLAVANTLLKDPAYWRSVDPGSHGPLTELPLIVGKLSGFALDYSMAKAVNLGLGMFSVCLLYLAYALLFSENSARIAAIPLVGFYALTHYWDFISFNAEGPLILLLSLALFQLGRLFAKEAEAQTLLQWYLFGLVLGAVPYSKLQGVPIALVITAWGGVVLWTQQADWKARLRLAAGYFFGGVTCSGIVGCYLIVFGLWNDFIFRYLLQNFLYTQRVSQSLYHKIRAFIFEFSSSSPTNTFYKQQFAIICFFLAACLTVAIWKNRNSLKSLLNLKKIYSIKNSLFSYLLATISAYCIFIPGHIFQHYMLLLIPSLGLLQCSLLYFLEKNNNKYLFFVFTVCVLYASVSFALNADHFHQKLDIFKPHNLYATNTLPISKMILQLEEPGENMVVWGWYYRLHVETELPMATRTTPMHIFGIPQLKETYLNAFIEEFKKAKPDFFVEAVGEKMFIFNDKKAYGLDSYPRIQQIIDDDYDYIASSGSFRVFKRKR